MILALIVRMKNSKKKKYEKNRIKHYLLIVAGRWNAVAGKLLPYTVMFNIWNSV